MHDQWGMYGADRDIPNKYAGFDLMRIPEGLTLDWAGDAELRAAGFLGGPDSEPMTREPGTAPLSELLVGGKQSVPIRTVYAETMSRALRDDEGRILAFWDDGRWWTPEESQAFTAEVIEESRACNT